MPGVKEFLYTAPDVGKTKINIVLQLLNTTIKTPEL